MKSLLTEYVIMHNKVFYTSDTHFGHANIIQYCNRPFQSATEMDEHLISAWNRKVGVNDTVFHLGDVIFGGCDRMAAILPRLNGSKILIVGNHDRESMLGKHFSKVYHLFTFTDPTIKRKMCLCHYPIESWPGMHREVIHLHGHCHGTLKSVKPNRMDVGVDCNPKFEPFSSAEVLQALNKEVYV